MNKCACAVSGECEVSGCGITLEASERIKKESAKPLLDYKGSFLRQATCSVVRQSGRGLWRMRNCPDTEDDLVLRVN